MNIKEKIYMDYNGLVENGPITIVAFGDSITHGVFGINEIDYDAVYWNQLRKKILTVRNFVPVNVIDAGIGGITAPASLARLESQVLVHNPDLVIVCFGLNDVANVTLEEYIGALRKIFESCKERNVECIFMTPNMLNTYVADGIMEELLEYAALTADIQNNGKMDTYMDAAKMLAAEMEIPVCDCYSVWKERSKSADIVNLLDNKINHPNREMHKLFADMLFSRIMDY